MVYVWCSELFVCGQCVVHVWYICGMFVVHVWRMWYMCGACVVHVWCVCGARVVRVWRVCGVACVWCGCAHTRVL